MRIAAFMVWSLVLMLVVVLVLGWGGGARAASAQAPEATAPATLLEPSPLALAQLLADRHERAGIEAERRRLESDYGAEERACADRFVVSGCVDDVRTRRRAALAPLRERELQLDAAERRLRAAKRRAAVAAKTAAAASRPAAPEPAADARRREPPASPVSGPSAQPRSTSPAAAARAAEAGERAQSGRVREQQVQESQQRIRRRLDDREARGRKADPLPVPESAPSAAAR